MTGTSKIGRRGWGKLATAEIVLFEKVLDLAEQLAEALLGALPECAPLVGGLEPDDHLGDVALFLERGQLLDEQGRKALSLLARRSLVVWEAMDSRLDLDIWKNWVWTLSAG